MPAPQIKDILVINDEIDEWLEADKKARRKQRHTAKRIYERLCILHAEDFELTVPLSYWETDYRFCKAKVKVSDLLNNSLEYYSYR